MMAPDDLRFTVSVEIDGQSTDLPTLLASAAKIMVEPCLDLLAKMIEDGRVTKDEKAGLVEQLRERQERFREFLRRDLADSAQDSDDPE